MSAQRPRSGGLFGRRGRRDGEPDPLPRPDAPAPGAPSRENGPPARPDDDEPTVIDDDQPIAGDDEPPIAADDEPATDPSGNGPATRSTAAEELEPAIRELRTAIYESIAAARAPAPAAEPPEIEPAAVAAREPETEARRHVAGPLEAFIRHPFLTLLPVALLVGGAVYLGTVRDPEFTAHARIKVGRDDVPAQVLQNAAYGNQVVAVSYSRAIAASSVVAQAAREAGVSVRTARRRLGATSVPESTLIDVEAKGPSDAEATRLANAGARALIAYVTDLSRTGAAKRLLRQYRTAQAKVRELEARLRRLGHKRGVRSSTLARAQLDIDEADLKATQLANNYRAETSSNEVSGAHLELLAPAAGAKSDRRSVLEELIVIAAAAGLVLGFAFALLRTNWGVLRARRA
jgi:hypothetical protein